MDGIHQAEARLEQTANRLAKQTDSTDVVSLSDDHYLNGGFTLIDHGQGVSTAYLHQSKRLVKAGDTVKRGQRIGLIGATGRATGPHLHWAMNWFEVRLDPSLSTRKPKPEPL